MDLTTIFYNNNNNNIMLVFYCFLLFDVIVNANSVFAITTNQGASPFTNNSQSLLVQGRALLHNPTRLLLHHRSNLSPVQQTHILDDIQKNQRFHYTPTSSHPERHRMYNTGFTPFIDHQSTVYPSPSPMFDTSSYPQYSSSPVGTLPPPPVHNLVLSTQYPLQSNWQAEQYIASLKSPIQFNQPVNRPSPDYIDSSSTSSTPLHPLETIYSTSTIPQYSTYPTANPESIFYTTPVHSDNNTYIKFVQSDSKLSQFPEIVTTNNKGIKEIYLNTDPQLLIAKDRQKFFQQLLESNKDESDYPKNDQTTAQSDVGNIRLQFEKFLRQYSTSVQKNLTDGVAQNVQSNTQTSAPPTSTQNILEQLTKDVLPPGADFEVIRHNKDGNLEEVGKLPQNLPEKKVTFVILEEQPDGSVKLQGIRGSEKEPLKESGEEVDSILKKIKEGQLKLPSSSGKKVDTFEFTKQAKNGGKFDSKKTEDHRLKHKSKLDNDLLRSLKHKELLPTTVQQPPQAPSGSFLIPVPNNEQSGSEQSAYLSPFGDVFVKDGKFYFSSTESPMKPSEVVKDWNYDEEIRGQPPVAKYNGYDVLPYLSVLNKQPSASSSTSSKPETPFLPTLSHRTTTAQSVTHDTTPHKTSTTVKPKSHATSRSAGSQKSHSDLEYDGKPTKNVYRKPVKPETTPATPSPQEIESEENTPYPEYTRKANYTLSDILKREGFYAMAKFLKQSGLDNILNDTGPFTLFVPSDKAFRTLLIQLGGPDKAEEKFKDNPRLLSGLLLHHVIPGAFRVSALQDEMTGVSLAGTQLRVNTYTTHDIEWNDIKVVTINGARILDENDLIIPQGIAHAIDRVMFPLPVGNLLQTLQADREGRFSNFLRILDQSELSSLLRGSKTYTVFAPLNRAFSNSDLNRLLTDVSESKSFVLRHVVPGALYSAGMKYYQVRDSMDDRQQITLYKEAGRIKVNSAHVVSRNIPATNGVVHALDAFL